MSRSINIGYRTSRGGTTTDIEIRSPYDLLGTQQTSKRFWSLPVWERLAVTQLAELGNTDPVYFVGWDMMDDLANEIMLFSQNIAEIDFDAEIKSSWLAHLVYCYNLLILTAPSDSIPEFSIG